MKKKHLYMASLTALLLGMSACTSEAPVDKPAPGPLSGDYPVSVTLRGVTQATPATYAVVSAEGFESALTSTQALIFDDGGKYLGNKPVTVSNVQPAGDATHDTKGTATFDASKEYGAEGKTIQFVLVGNLNTSDLASALSALATAKSKAAVTDLTLDDMKELHITQASDVKNQFVMLGKPQGGAVASVKLQRNIAQAYTGTIDMQRLSARIDVKLGEAPGNKNQGLSITSVKVVKRQTKSYLYEKGGKTDNLTSDETKDYTSAPFVKSIYTYENSKTADTHVEVQLALNNVPLRTVTVPFTDLAILRNHIYTVELNRNPNDNTVPGDPTINPPRITFKVDVEDWKVDYRYMEDYKNEDAPTVSKVTGYNTAWSAPLAANEVKHTANATNTDIAIRTGEAYNLLLDVTGKSTQSEGVVIEGAQWLSLKDITTYAGMEQHFQLEVKANPVISSTPRVGKVEFRNKLKPGNKVTVTISQLSRPKMALEYVSEYAVNSSRLGFVTTHSNTDADFGYYNWADAKAIFASGTALALQGWHLPSRNECHGIFNDHVGSASTAIRYSESSLKENISETIEIAGQTATYRGDYKNMGNVGGKLITYALRYKDATNTRLSAWRYSYEDNTHGGGGKMLVVQAVYLGEGFSGTVNTFASEQWWSDHASEAVTRIFPTYGYNSNGTAGMSAASPINRGSYGYCWSATAFNSSSAYYMGVGNSYAFVYNGYQAHGMAVRPFSE
ncbi:hypothetical protein [Porphyromonas pogonae]|uniref:hypothetical protein n=1 Tax=Porphyromonas pogonae TaxID=867595 RepID=UPI002E783114|nr:hypothetical protein [Porphyromonas pogonae]